MESNNFNKKFIEAFSIWQLSIRLYLGYLRSSNWTREFSESLSIFSWIIFKSFMSSTILLQQRKKWELDSGSRLQVHRGFIQFWKLCLNLCSLRWLSSRHKWVRYFRPIGLNIFINEIEQRMTIIQRISFLNFKNQSTVLISGLSLFHASIKEGIKEFLKISVLQLKLSTLSNCWVL